MSTLGFVQTNSQVPVKKSEKPGDLEPWGPPSGLVNLPPTKGVQNSTAPGWPDIDDIS